MFRTIFSVACIGAVNAVSLHKEEAPATALDVEEVLAKAQSGDYTTEDVENIMEHVDHHMKGKDITDAIDWAAEQGIGFDEVKAMIEGVEVSGAFDKHDIYDFAMEACCHFEATEEGLDEMLHYAAEKLGIDAEQGQELLETAGEVFDISQEEFDQAVQDCFDIGAKCAAKNAEKSETERREPKLAEADWTLEDLLEVDLETLTAEEVANWLKENGEELMKKLEAKQEEVVAFIHANKDKIEQFVANNKEELEQFAKDLEAEFGEIDWEAVKAAGKEWFEEGMAKIEEKKRAGDDRKPEKKAKEE